jgi:hypothetical protein
MKRTQLTLLSSLYYFHHDVAYNTYTAIGRLVEWNVKIEQIIIIIKKERERGGVHTYKLAKKLHPPHTITP